MPSGWPLVVTFNHNMAGIPQTLPVPPLVNEMTMLNAIRLAAEGGGGGGGTGNVVGPASSTNDAVALWDGATGQLLKDSSIFITGGGTVALGGFTLTVPSTGTAALLQASNIFTANGATSSPAMWLNGGIFSGGSSETTKPLFLIEPDGTVSTGWSTAGTFFGVNAQSGFAGRMLDLQLNGVTTMNVTSAGLINASGFNLLNGSTLPNYGMAFDGASLLFYAGGTIASAIYGTQFILRGTQQLLWSSDASYSSTRDAGFERSAAALIKVSNGSGGYGTLDVLGIKVSGVAGANAGPFTVITSITVTNGIVTAITGT